MDKLSFFILNLFVNSFLCFFTVFLLIEGIIFLFRIPQGRVAATLRMVPILKLPFDLCLYDFSRWTYIRGINPLTCEEGTRSLSVMIGWMEEGANGFFWPINSGIQLVTHGNMTFTIADILGNLIAPKLLNILILFFIIISTILLAIKFIKYYQSIKSLNSLAKTGQLIDRKIENSTLAYYLKKYRIQVFTSARLEGSPFVVSLTSPSVYIPRQLLPSFSRGEYEAVLAHEIEHIRYKDSLVRLILDLITSIFWWIPTRWSYRYIEEGQEVGCDFRCQHYGIQPLDLANAICKSLRYSKNKPTYFFAYHLTKNTICKRVSIILNPSSPALQKINWFFSSLAIGIVFLLVFFGKFWIF